MPPRVDDLLGRLAAVGELVDEAMLTVSSMASPSPTLDPRVRTDDRLRELLVVFERVQNAAEAAQAEVMTALADEADDLDAAELAATGAPSRSHSEFVPDEIALLLAVTKTAAGRRHGLALRARGYRALVGAWRAGQLDARKVQVITDELIALRDAEVRGGLSPAEIAALGDELATAAAEYARTHTWSETRAWLRRRIIQIAPDVAELRRGRAEHERRVEITPADDGMSELWALLPAVDARQVQQALSSAAHELGSADPRTMDQRRADLLVDWLLGPGHAPTVHLHLLAESTVSEDAELDTASWLPGVGPLTQLQTEDLIASAGRTVTVASPLRDREQAPETGYRPSASLERGVRARDVTCRFPGCRRSAIGVGTGTDLDHAVAWPIGTTEAGNLAVLCRRHHRLKHSPGWQVTLLPDGSMSWVGPSGRSFTSQPWQVAPPVPPPRE